ncbi:S-adenosyl-L-methionine:L-histidine 3-amino-3-carboxypropyltransferase 2 [Hyphodiscus hymeniophilus]|uniref:2-(3-amino-3-carboxypropyl)histidine synthase subunit 2 n=1 Tax=Hyphodiscus hymeniophilus TaxID=353542 RepID=A0A9P6SK05_9HELO|nr:S-adenosyl-L-methionine:L-histidine 3-amino-3-carboxypropyltransferase 2 [Hyphodiscus hymeniophilus]
MPDEVQLHAPPVLSTPESHIFEDPTPLTTSKEPRLADEEIWSVYEVDRTAREICDGGWKRVALQFPDHMLGDAVRVFEGLEKQLKLIGSNEDTAVVNQLKGESLETSFNHVSMITPGIRDGEQAQTRDEERNEKHRLSILADTSYGACCVDEIASEHVDAEVVVHYGRSCLSPTARLPVIYIFTFRPMDTEDVVAAFEITYAGEDESSKEERVVLMADITYHSHIPVVREALGRRGWKNIFAPEVVHDPSSLIPNRKIELSEEELKDYSVFHISDPPPALLLTLSSRVKDLHIYPTTSSSTPTRTVESNTRIALRRRYGLLTSLSTCGIFGILINTLSVRNYLATVTAIKDQIAAAGKKSYTFVVGKVNAAKIANFSEIGGWVVIGCWESSLIESTEFYRPIITPFELGICLMSDEERVWSGSWRGDFESLEIRKPAALEAGDIANTALDEHEDGDLGRDEIDGGDLDLEEESAPPEFDLRTGRYVSHSRPMRKTMISPPTNSSSSAATPTSMTQGTASNVLARRAKLDVATVNGAVSPGAEYLRSQRTWTGLGSDFNEADASENIEEGRAGVARGYTIGEGAERR